MDMSLTASPVYIGIDVAKDRLDVHVLPAAEAFSCWSGSARWRRR